MAYTWTKFTAYLDGSRPITADERDELYAALAERLSTCGGRYQLKADDIDAIKASSLLTDVTSIEAVDDPDDALADDLATILIAYEDAFTGVTGLDAFKAVAPAEGLSDDQLAELITSSGRITNVDAYQIWNLYKRVLTFLQCCPTTLPTLEWDSVGKSWAKWGWPSFTGPLRYFISYTLSGSIARTYHTENSAYPSCVPAGYVYTINTTSYSGGATWPKPGPENIEGDASQNCKFEYRLGEEGEWSVETPSYPALYQAWGSSLPVCSASADYAEFTDSPETRVAVGDGLCHIFGGSNTAVTVGTLRLDLGTELTDDLLREKVGAAIDAEGFDDDWNDTAGSYRNLDTYAMTYSERKAKVRAALAGVSLVVGLVYRLYYFGRFTPLVGVPVDEEEEYIEFTFASGMTHLSPMTIAVPAANGTNSIVLLRWECGPFEEDGE